MVRSSLSGLPRTFLVKVNPEAAPGRIGVPQEAPELMRGPFLTQHPRKTIQRDGQPRIRLPSNQTADPQISDQAYIWINEEYGGRGLTARGRISNLQQTHSGLSIQVTDVDLLLAASIGRQRAASLARSGNIFDDILRSTSGASLRWISDQDVHEIDEAVRRYTNRERTPPLPPAPAPSPPPRPDPEELTAERQRVMRLIEQRANQGSFRDAVAARDGQRCLVTGCRAVEVLEAAHLIPYASGHPERDNTSNGVLLRADIHLLFDRGLMAIDPETMRVWVSAGLRPGSYGRVHGKAVRTAAGLRYLQYQYEFATGLTRISR